MEYSQTPDRSIPWVTDTRPIRVIRISSFTYITSLSVKMNSVVSNRAQIQLTYAKKSTGFFQRAAHGIKQRKGSQPSERLDWDGWEVTIAEGCHCGALLHILSDPCPCRYCDWLSNITSTAEWEQVPKKNLGIVSKEAGQKSQWCPLKEQQQAP